MTKPFIEIDLEQVGRAAAIGCSYEEIAVIVGVSRSTFYNRMRDDPEFAEMVEEGKARGRGTLRRLQWQRAQGGSDTMLIWLGKQVLGQKDRNELTGADDGPVAMVYRWADPPKADSQ